MRGRPKKYSVDKKRKVLVNLTGLASVILAEVRKKSKTFDFSKYVSSRLLMDFYSDNKEQVILNELNLLQFEQDVMNEHFNNRKRAKAIELSNIQEKRIETKTFK